MLEFGETLALAFHHLRDGNSRPARHDFGNVFGGDFLLEEARSAALLAGEFLFGLAHLSLELRNLSVGDFRGLLQISGARDAFRLGSRLLDLLLDLADRAERLFFLLPLSLHARGFLAQLGEVTLECLQALARRFVFFFLQSLSLDLQLRDSPLDLVDFLRHRIDLDAEPRRGLVDQIDRFVGQEPVTDVAIGQGGGGNDGAVGDAHSVVRLVALLETPENGDGTLDAWLTDVNWLESAFERRVFLHVLPVFVEGGRADHAQLTPRQHRLEHVAGIHRPFRLPCPDERVHLVDEHDELTLSLGDLFEHGFEALFELAAEFGAGDQRAKVESDQPLVLETLRHIPIGDALGETLGDGRLPDSGLADQDRIVFGAPRQDLDDASDFFVPTDYWIELAFARGVGEIAGVALERLILIFGRLVGDAVRAAHLLQRFEQALVGGANTRQKIPALGTLDV